MHGHGTGEEYLLRRLKKIDAERGTDYAAKWAAGDGEWYVERGRRD